MYVIVDWRRWTKVSDCGFVRSETCKNQLVKALSIRPEQIHALVATRFSSSAYFDLDALRSLYRARPKLAQMSNN